MVLLTVKSWFWIMVFTVSMLKSVLFSSSAAIGTTLSKSLRVWGEYKFDFTSINEFKAEVLGNSLA